MNILDFRTILFGYLVSNAVCVLFVASLWLGKRAPAPATDDMARLPEA